MHSRSAEFVSEVLMTRPHYCKTYFEASNIRYNSGRKAEKLKLSNEIVHAFNP